MSSRRIACAVLSWWVAACADGTAAGNLPPDVLPTGGINLGAYNYFDRGVPFIDFAKMSQRWLSSDGRNWSDDRPLELTATGYPSRLLENQIARSLIFTHNGSEYETGEYEVTWEGTGRVRLSSAFSSVNPIFRDSNSARYDVTSPRPLGLLMELVATDPSDPVRDIKVIPTRYKDQTSPFHPSYVRDLENYGVLRFMDWGPTNGNSRRDWDKRSQLDQAHWGGRKGIPYEMQIALGNETQQDIWLTIPHEATDDYITQLGRLVNEQLDPGLRVWIEYTNEAWNGSFSQNDYVRNVLTERYGTTRMSEAYAYRAGEVFDVFSREVPPERMLRVVGAWAATPFILRNELPVLTDDQGNINADVAAIATYFRLSSDQMAELFIDYKADQVDLDQVFVDLRTSIDQVSKRWEDNRKLATASGLPLVSYEGGQGIITTTAAQGNNEGFGALLSDIQLDPRMGELYTYMAERWREIGGSTLTLFNNMDPWGSGGSWGLKQGFDDPVAPKFDAVQAYLESNPGGWDLRTDTWLGDIDGNGFLDVTDIELLTQLINDGSTDETLDFNRDGLVDLGDHSFWVTELKATLPGDTNLDGKVGTDDLIAVFQFGTYEDQIAFNSTWSTGDWNGDLEFGSNDLIAMLQAGGVAQLSAAARAVPEPTGAAGLLLTLLWLVARRRQ